MRTLLCVLACGLVTSAFAQTNPLPPRNLTLNWVADEHNELTVPVDTRAIRVTLPPTILYSATVFQCGGRVSQRVVSVRGNPVIELVANAPGPCHVSFETSRRSYSLDLTVRESTPQKPIAPVASVTWSS